MEREEGDGSCPSLQLSERRDEAKADDSISSPHGESSGRLHCTPQDRMLHGTRPQAAEG
jgi:hypothetical protein